MDGLKQRIIGAVVLVALAVIFIPMIFEDPHHKKTTQVLSIPDKPEVPAFTIELPKPPERNQGESASAKLSSAESKNSTQIEENAKTLMTVAELKASDELAKDGSAGQADEQQKAKPEISETTTQKADLAKHTAADSNAWAVQIGTFRNRPGAMKIKEELMQSGTPAYTADIVSGDIEMVRVFAGPAESKDDALKLKSKVDKRYNLQSLVVTYKAP
jgi:DedD protein